MGTSYTGAGRGHTRDERSTLPPSLAVIEAIARLETVEPSHVRFGRSRSLTDYVDPDALDALVTGTDDVTVSFTIDDYRVRIDGNGVEVRRD